MKKAPKPHKIETNENGNWLLDPTNPHHVEWIENDAAYEEKEEDSKSANKRL